MQPASQALVFQNSPLILAVTAVFVLAVAVLCFTAWRRSGFRRGLGFLELLRLLIAIGVAITFNQPEWREVFKPDHKPTLAILADSSQSMMTEDVMNPSLPAAEPKSRADSIRPLIDESAWSALKERLDIVIEPFSSKETPAESGTDINEALAAAMEKHPRLRAAVLITDGDWNSGEAPSIAATKLRMRDVPVFAVPAGSETKLPDAELASFDAPAFGVAGKPVRIPFVIDSSLPRDERVTLEMTSSTGEVVTKEVTLPAMGRLQDALVWRPLATGDAKLKLTVPLLATERFPNNNSLEAPIAIRKEQLQVLVIESFPRWEYRYLRNALERDPGVEVSCLLFHPDLEKPGAGKGYLSAFPSDEALTGYDVIFLGDVGIGKGQLTAGQCASLQKMVRDQASGLVFLPGMRGHQLTLMSSSLADLFPIVFDEAQPRGWGSNVPGKFTLTDSGAKSLLTKLEDTDEASARVWSSLPGFQWYAAAMRAKAGAEVLATHGTESTKFGRVPLIVTKTYGAGKILFMGADGAWRWRRGVEDKYHYRFWGQVVRWMAYQRNMASSGKMRLFYSPDRPQSGDVLTLNANVMSASGEPLREGNVIAQIESPGGKAASVRLLPAGEEAWGLFTGTFTPAEPGEHRIQLSSAESGASLDAVIAVQGAAREKLGQAARHEVLREIAQLTRGKFIASLDPAEIAKAVASLPEPEPIERRLPLWPHPLWAGLLVLLMGVFWVCRKAIGVF